MDANGAGMYALALSGGGFRATLFHLGALIRLNERSLLPRLSRICGVSGGSINAALLGARWHALGFDGQGRAANLEREIIAPLKRFCSRPVDMLPSLANMARMLLGLPSTMLQAVYDRELFRGVTLQQLPGPGEGPRVELIGYNLVTAAPVLFSRDGLKERRLGRLPLPGLSLALAVAASSAYPPFLSPVVLETDPVAWERLPGADLRDDAKAARRLVMTDGGVYDALGVEPLWHDTAVLLVSDAVVTKALWRPGSSWPRQWLRAMLLATINTAIARRQALTEFSAGTLPRCIYWGNEAALDGSPPGAMWQENETTRALERIRTRLDRFTPLEQGRLINWGYARCEAALSVHLGQAGQPAPPTWPEPDCAL